MRCQRSERTLTIVLAICARDANRLAVVGAMCSVARRDRSSEILGHSCRSAESSDGVDGNGRGQHGPRHAEIAAGVGDIRGYAGGVGNRSVFPVRHSRSRRLRSNCGDVGGRDERGLAVARRNDCRVEIGDDRGMRGGAILHENEGRMKVHVIELCPSHASTLARGTHFISAAPMTESSPTWRTPAASMARSAGSMSRLGHPCPHWAVILSGLQRMMGALGRPLAACAGSIRDAEIYQHAYCVLLSGETSVPSTPTPTPSPLGCGR